MGQETIHLLGGGVYAVTTAARLSRKGHKTYLIPPSRRLGLFPFTLLPQQFFDEMNVKPTKHIEAEITALETENDTVELRDMLYVCRTTPLLEEVATMHNIGYTSKQPPATKLIDCTGTQWREIRCIQTLETAPSEKNRLQIDAVPSKHLSVTVYFSGLALKTLYTKTMTPVQKEVLASAERATAFKDPETMQTVPTVSLLGPDHGEWRPNTDQALAEAEAVERLLSIDSDPAELNVFIQRILSISAKGGEQLG